MLKLLYQLKLLSPSSTYAGIDPLNKDQVTGIAPCFCIAWVFSRKCHLLSARYLQGEGEAVTHVVLISFQLFYLLLQLQPLLISLLQDLLPLFPEFVL